MVVAAMLAAVHPTAQMSDMAPQSRPWGKLRDGESDHGRRPTLDPAACMKMCMLDCNHLSVGALCRSQCTALCSTLAPSETTAEASNVTSDPSILGLTSTTTARAMVVIETASLSVVVVLLFAMLFRMHRRRRTVISTSFSSASPHATPPKKKRVQLPRSPSRLTPLSGTRTLFRRDPLDESIGSSVVRRLGFGEEASKMKQAAVDLRNRSLRRALNTWSRRRTERRALAREAGRCMAITSQGTQRWRR